MEIQWVYEKIGALYVANVQLQEELLRVTKEYQALIGKNNTIDIPEEKTDDAGQENAV